MIRGNSCVFVYFRSRRWRHYHADTALKRFSFSTKIETREIFGYDLCDNFHTALKSQIDESLNCENKRSVCRKISRDI